MTNKKRLFSVPAVGSSSLLVIFTVLCLTVFALLSINTVQAEKRLADISIESVAAYYEADCQAEIIFSQLREGADLPYVSSDGNVYTFTCPISETQELVVMVEHVNGHWDVLRWQAVSIAEIIPENTLSLWDGSST